jgi:homoserine kinase type II
LIAIEQLPIDREQRKQLQSQFSSIMEQAEKLYEELPQQILHRDYDPGNVLVKDNHITAVLDFDFSGVDIRIFDLSIALSWWPYRATGTEREWEIIDTFGAAYIARFPLSTAELHAIPDVMRLRDAVSFVHRTGRYLAGLETDAGIHDRVQHSFWREAWLTNNHSKLLQHIARWNSTENREKEGIAFWPRV